MPDKRLRLLEEENRKLRKLAAEQAPGMNGFWCCIAWR